MNETLISEKNTQQAEKEQHISKILLVDDKEENLFALESILEESSREILKATSGKDALKIILENDISVILLDVQMPDMDGFEVVQMLKQNPQTSHIAVIFVTALDYDEKYQIKGYVNGAADFLYKPLKNEVVRAKVALFEKLHCQSVELNKYVKKTEQINKQLDEFVYIVSHDLKAPLRGITSLVTFLEDELGPDSKNEAKELMEMIKGRAHRMQSLIEGILHYSRMANNVTERERFHLGEHIGSIIDLVSPPDNIKVEYPDNLPFVFAEKIKYHEIFQNLISNGIKYNDKKEGFVKITYLEYEGYYEFAIADNGIGIKPEHFEKVFGVFQTLQPKDRQDSTGIGLTIVKKLIEQENGRIWIESIYGEGTTFKFTLAKHID